MSLPGCLVEGVHDQLFANLRGFAKVAGVPERMIYTPLSATCGEAEVDWVRGFHKNAAAGILGLLYVGAWKPSVERRMQAIAGTLVRNFMDARVMSVEAVAALRRDEEPSMFSCLLVPSILGFSAWAFQGFVATVMERVTQEKLTVLAVPSRAALKTAHPELARVVESNFAVLE